MVSVASLEQSFALLWRQAESNFTLHGTHITHTNTVVIIVWWWLFLEAEAFSNARTVIIAQATHNTLLERFVYAANFCKKKIIKLGWQYARISRERPACVCRLHCALVFLLLERTNDTASVYLCIYKNLFECKGLNYNAMQVTTLEFLAFDCIIIFSLKQNSK